MPEEYTALVNDLKNMTQVDNETQVTLPMAEDEWNTRPDTVSYGIVIMDFENDSFNGDDVKLDASHEGSVHLFSMVRSGAGWVPLITGVLTSHCGPRWSLNSHVYERETGLFHWEWTFEV